MVMTLPIPILTIIAEQVALGRLLGYTLGQSEANIHEDAAMIRDHPLVQEFIRERAAFGQEKAAVDAIIAAIDRAGQIVDRKTTITRQRGNYAAN
jgi:hypothetical protein